MEIKIEFEIETTKKLMKGKGEKQRRKVGGKNRPKKRINKYKIRWVNKKSSQFKIR